MDKKHLEHVAFHPTRNFESDEFHTVVADNMDRACKLAEAKFEYVTGEYDDGGRIFRKRK